MKTTTIGSILKKRIKEKGYTQEDFAEECGIGLSTLGKYMRGERMYNYELLEIFAKKLDCTYDFLLGKSVVPEKKYQDARNETKLSITSIDNIKKLSEDKLAVIDLLLSDMEMLEYFVTFFSITPEVNEHYIKIVNSDFIEKLYGLNEIGDNILPDFYTVAEIALRIKLDKMRNIYQNNNTT
ncbi:MAG: helix-turn-helix transcriptional regulator [Ruminococcaceae bacterium]|nr:helix-turn-helix transcriptional regulator [Oscillospiraceae bacterium]